MLIKKTAPLAGAVPVLRAGELAEPPDDLPEAPAVPQRCNTTPGHSTVPYSVVQNRIAQ